MPVNTKNIAILGCGKVAHLHAKAIQNLPHARLAAVWSRTAKTAEDFAGKYNTKARQNISEMIIQDKINLAIVCTPHPFHRQPVIEATKAGAHVLVEKPLASTLEDCDVMISACKAAGKKLGVVSQR